MPDLGWTELFALVVIAVVVVGPRELPGLMRQVARFTRAARQAAQEFRDSLDELAREAELEEVRRRANPVDYDTPDSVVDPTTGHSAPRQLLPEGAGVYEPPADAEEASSEHQRIKAP
jgi:sec-independent protein translocase protein TatB